MARTKEEKEIAHQRRKAKEADANTTRKHMLNDEN